MAILGALLLVGSAVLLAGCSSSTTTTAQVTTVATSAATTTTGGGATVGGALAAEATKLAAEKSGYTQECAGCHGPTGDGASTGPSLAASKDKSVLSLTKAITLGTGSMPGFKDKVNAAKIAAMIALIKSPDFATGGSTGAGATGTSTTPSS